MKIQWLKILLPTIVTLFVGFGVWTVKAVYANAQETAVQKQRTDDLKGDVKYIRDRVDELNNKWDNIHR